MSNQLVIIKDGAFFNVDSGSWVASSATIWDTKDKLLEDIQGLVIAGKIDPSDNNIHVREVVMMAGKHGCVLCDFIFKHKDKDIVNNALAKLSPTEIEALKSEFRRTHDLQNK